jgi:hypothetical protein
VNYYYNYDIKNVGEIKEQITIDDERYKRILLKYYTGGKQLRLGNEIKVP